MKTFNCFLSSLSSKKNFKLKKKMGFPITLADIDNIHIKVKKRKRLL